MMKVAIYYISFLLIRLGVAGIVVFLKGEETGTDATSAIITVAAANILVIILFLSFRWAQVSRSYVQSRPWAALTWCGLAAIGAIIPSTWMQEMLPALPNWAEAEFDLILRNRWGYFAVGLLAPVCEELVFRGAILKELLKQFRHPWLSITISALLFALAHANPAQTPYAILAGVLLGWMYYRTGSVVPGVVFHWVNNTIAYIIYNIFPSPDMKLIELFGSQQRVLMAVGFSLLILLPALFQLNERLKHTD